MSQLILFKDLVKRDNGFKPCPNCGKTAVMQGRYGWDGLVVADPECQKCKCRFVEQRIGLFRRRVFAVMTPEEHSKMVRDSLARHFAMQTAQ